MIRSLKARRRCWKTMVTKLFDIRYLTTSSIILESSGSFLQLLECCGVLKITKKSRSWLKQRNRILYTFILFSVTFTIDLVRRKKKRCKGCCNIAWYQVYILSISGGNIFTSLGGTEKVILSQQKMFNAVGISYVYIYPVSKKVSGLLLYNYWGVVVDGKMVGLFETKQLLSFLGTSEGANIFGFWFLYHGKSIH